MTVPSLTPSQPAGGAPSFARRHPILTGFGVLAGLSLFAAYFPISAVITGVVVGGHATGLDRAALRVAQRAGAWLRVRVHRDGNQPAREQGRPDHGRPAPAVRARERGVGGPERRELPRPQRRQVGVHPRRRTPEAMRSRDLEL